MVKKPFDYVTGEYVKSLTDEELSELKNELHDEIGYVMSRHGLVSRELSWRDSEMCPECTEGRLMAKWSGVTCNECGYSECF